MQAYLKKHGNDFANYSIKIDWERFDRRVVIHFQITKRIKSEWNTDSLFTADWAKNWGLWNKDVMEAFLQLRSTPDDIKAPYLEIQVSPLNQPFALVITEPRKTYFPPKTLTLETKSEVKGQVWSGEFNVELPKELKGPLLYGGLFACLSVDPREYFALEPNPEVNPDFHRPELFLALDK